MYIPCNVGGAEKNLRMGMGITLLGMALTNRISKKPAKFAALTLGAIEVMTGLTNYCPINQLIGRNTCPTAHHPHET